MKIQTTAYMNTLTTNATYTGYYKSAVISRYWNDADKAKPSDPSSINYNPDGTIRDVCWLDNKELHNDNGPARIVYYKTGNKHIEYYATQGQITLEIEYTPKGRIRSVIKNGRNIAKMLKDAHYFETDDQSMRDMIWEMI